MYNKRTVSEIPNLHVLVTCTYSTSKLVLFGAQLFSCPADSRAHYSAQLIPGPIIVPC